MTPTVYLALLLEGRLFREDQEKVLELDEDVPLELLLAEDLPHFALGEHDAHAPGGVLVSLP